MDALNWIGLIGLGIVVVSVVVVWSASVVAKAADDRADEAYRELEPSHVRLVPTVEGDLLEIEDDLDVPIGRNLEREVELLTYDLETQRAHVAEFRRRLELHHVDVPAGAVCEVCSA